MSILLKSLLSDFVAESALATINNVLEIKSITLDSREVADGTLFVALQGTLSHGLSYATQATQAGASAIVYEPVTSITDDNSSLEGDLIDQESLVPFIRIENLRSLLGAITQKLLESQGYSYPKVNIGVTGTDGKTSVSYFVASALDAITKDVAIIGTIGIGRIDQLAKATHTTPDVISLHKILTSLSDDSIDSRSVDTIVMEVSSHALDQQRVNGINFDVAVLTNLTRDHLDYHKTVEAYGNAKRQLFTDPSSKSLVLNGDDELGLSIAEKTTKNTILYSMNKDFNHPVLSKNNIELLVADNIQLSTHGINATICFQGRRQAIQASVLARFNLSNILATIATLLLLGNEFEIAIKAIKALKTVPGRMQIVSLDEDHGYPMVIVDYAHTPAALESVLKATGEHIESQILCVFGCGGDRDKGKRPLMASVAEQYANQIFVTDDNPRSEPASEIMNDIKAGFSSLDNVSFIHDRKSAIESALSSMQEGDALVIAGKGHEAEQIFADRTIPFNDYNVAQSIMQEVRA